MSRDKSPRWCFELTRAQHNRETLHELVLHLPPSLLEGVELHQARCLLANTGNVVEVQYRSGIHGGTDRDLRLR